MQRNVDEAEALLTARSGGCPILVVQECKGRLATAIRVLAHHGIEQTFNGRSVQRPRRRTPRTRMIANITNAKTRRFYKSDVQEFSVFTGVHEAAGFRTVTRAHVIAWRKSLEPRNLMPASIRRKLSALSSLFDYLCERNVVVGNTVDGVERLATNGNTIRDALKLQIARVKGGDFNDGISRAE